MRGDVTMHVLKRWPASRGHVATAAGVAMIALVGACSRGPSGATGRPAASRLLSAVDSLALVATARVRGEEVNSLDPTMLETRAESSRVVPGLVYYRSMYGPSGSAHMESVVVLAQRDTQLVILLTAEEFAALSGHWMPDRPETASALCGELTEVLGHASTAVLPPLVFEAADDWRKMGFGSPGPPWRARVGAPNVNRSGPEQWIVQLWVAEPGRIAKYECKLRAGSSPSLKVIDSILGAGFAPDKP